MTNITTRIASLHQFMVLLLSELDVRSARNLTSEWAQFSDDIDKIIWCRDVNIQTLIDDRLNNFETLLISIEERIESGTHEGANRSRNA